MPYGNKSKEKRAARLYRRLGFPNHLVVNPVADAELSEGMVVMWMDGVDVTWMLAPDFNEMLCSIEKDGGVGF